MNNYCITGEFVTQSPLSHIGETISTITYLVEEPILQPNGEIEDVFIYNGNAWRGQLRDLAAMYMLNKLGITVGLDAFHLLFSGGKISGDQSIDLNQARAMRKAIPMISVFGGGVGNQILPGKLRIGGSYPVCIEAIPALRDEYHLACLDSSYRQLTTEKSFTRTDDGKNPNLMPVLNSDSVALLEAPDKKTKKDGDASTQMRMTSELLITGVKLVHEIHLMGVSDVELGVIVSALNKFAENPYIGGQCNRGHGKVSYRSKITNLSTGETNDFIKINGDVAKLSHKATEAKQAYDDHLQQAYDAYLAKSSSEITALLGSA